MMSEQGREHCRAIAVMIVTLSTVLCALMTIAPTASAAEASTVTVLRENFENPNFNCDTGWDQDGKEMWARGDNNANSGVDTWCHSKYRVSPSGNTYSLWCAVIGINSIAGSQSNTGSQRYDANMSAFIRHSLSMSPELGDGTLTFIYWSKTMASSALGGFDHLSVSVSADNNTYTTIWTQPSADEASWRQATVTVPSNAKTISFDFISGPYTSGTEWQEGAYIDNILVTQVSDPSWSHVISLPSYSPGSFDIDIHVDDAQGIPESVKLYYRSGTSGSFSLYSDPTHPDGAYSSGEAVHFDSSLTGGALDYQFYSIASGGGVTEPQPSVPDAMTSVDMTSPQTTASVDQTAGAGGWYDGPVSVHLAATDQRSGVEIIRYKLDNGTWSNFSSDISIGEEGAHLLAYYAVDKGGNSEAERSLSVGIDGTAPVTVYSIDGSGKLSLLSTDRASGVSSTRMRFGDEDEWRTFDSELDLVNIGHDAISYYAIDIAGNSETVHSLDLDNIPLSGVALDLGEIGPDHSIGETVTITWTCVDPSELVDHFEVLVDGVVVETLDRTATSCDLADLAQGERSVTVMAVDSGGNSTYRSVALNIGSTSNGDGSGGLLIIAIVVVVAIGAVGGLLFWRSKRSR